MDGRGGKDVLEGGYSWSWELSGVQHPSDV